MKHPTVNKIFVYATYGCAVAIGYKNIEMSALGLAGNNPISDLDWILSVGMAAFEFALSGALTTPAFWPILAGTINTAIDRVLDQTEKRKYQFVAIGLLVSFVTLLIFSTVQVYYWDIRTTELAIYANPTAPTEMERFKVYGLVFGPEALLAGAGLLSLASGIGGVQYKQINDRIHERRNAPTL
jgi:hypothetical protein